MELLRAIMLIGATLTLGVMAGVFQVYAYAFMPGLRRLEARAFIAAFQSVDRAIINPLFMANFLGALAFSLGAVLLHLGSEHREVLSWAGVALGFYAVSFIITIVVHVPLNDALKAAGDPEGITDPAEVRRRFNEARWASWNVVRAVASTTSLGCMAWALVEHGRP